MNVWLFRPEEYARRYNCDDFTQAEWFQFGQADPFIGVLTILLGIILQLFYIPFVVTMISPRWHFRHNSCYKFMFALGVFDVATINVGSVTGGYILTIGSVFCARPTISYISGAVGVGTWCASCTTCMLLTVNRCVEIYRPHWAKLFFGGNRAWCWLLLPIAVLIRITFFEDVCVMQSRYYGWFFNPYYGMNLTNRPLPGQTYIDYTHVACNIITIVVLWGSNALMTRHIYYISRIGRLSLLRQTVGTTLTSANTSADGGVNKRNESESTYKKQFTTQVVAICSLMSCCSFIYVYMQFVDLLPWQIFLGSVCFNLSSGCPSVIYIFLNHNLRRATLHTFRLTRASTFTISQSGIRDDCNNR